MMIRPFRAALAWGLSAVLALAPITDALAQQRNSFRPIFQPGGGVSASTNKPAVGANTATGQVPAGASASCKRNGTVTGSASVTAQGIVTCTFGSAIVAGDQFSIPWTLTGESPAATASNGPPPPVTIPANTAPPAISGTPQVGQTLASSTGSWSGSPTSYAYAWSAGGTQVQAGSSNTYVAQSGDVGKTLSVTVTATNTAGSASATSAATSAVTSAAQALNTIYTSGLLTNGLASSGIINGATPGSTITSNLTGLTVNSAARTYSWDGTGAAGSTANALTETPTSGSPKTSAATVLPASTGNLKASGRQFFVNEPAMFMILAGYASTSSLTVTSDDGTTITVGANSQGYPLAIGTFTTTGVKNLTITELKSDSTTSVSTMAVMVSPIPSAPTNAVAKVQAAKLNTAATNRKAVNVGSSPPTITLNTGASLVNGRSLASGGTTATAAVPDGASGTAGTVTQSQGYIYADTTNGPVAQTFAPGVSKRFVFTGTVGTRFDFKLNYPGTVPFGIINTWLYYTDEADLPNPTWYAIPDANVAYRQGVYYYDVNFPAAPARAGSRAVEIVLGAGLAMTGFNFETGATIAAYDDGRPRSGWWNDSYEYGPVVTTSPRVLSSGGKVVMDAFGTRNAVNYGHRTNGWARLGGTNGTHAYVPDRIGSNPWGLDESTKFGALDIMGGHMSINDNTLFGYTTASTSNKFVNQNSNFVPGATTFTNLVQLAFRRMRLMQPTAFIEIDVGMHGPDFSPSAAQLSAIRSVFSTVFDGDPLAGLVDLEAGSTRYRGQATAISGYTAPLVPSGAIGSSPLYPPGDCTFTGSISGNVLTVTAVSSGRLEPGMASGSATIFNDTTNGTYILANGTATGGVGTYILAYASGDKASQSFTYTGDKDHPNDTGYQRWGVERGKALVTFAGQAAALQ